MISANVDQALPPSRGFLRSYVEYASACSDAPEAYHASVALTILASVIGARLSCPWMAGRTLMPNLYTLLIGPSGASRKTGAMDAGIDVLQACQPELVIPIPGSYEETVAQIRQTPRGLLTYREFGHFLKTTQRGYGEAIRTVLMDLHDWPSDRPYTRNLRKGKTQIDPPICLSMLAACATDLLWTYADTEEWTGGFFGRMLLVYGERAVFRMPTTWFEARNYLVGLLTRWHGYGVPRCGGFSPEAWTTFEAWSRWRDSDTTALPERTQTHIARAPTLAGKVALLFAADSGEAIAGNGWLVSDTMMRFAITFVETIYVPSLVLLGERMAFGFWERDRRKVLAVIEKHGHIGIDRSALLRAVKLENKYLDSVLDTLREEGNVVQNGQDGRGLVLRLADPRKKTAVGLSGKIIPITEATAN